MKVSNPLTIIAIFAGLAETLATVALVQLPAEIQEVFVYFVMIFPAGIVLLFFLVLYFKSIVLYAPSDFENQNHYLEAHQIKENLSKKLDKIFTELNKDGAKLSEVEISKAKSSVVESIASYTTLSSQEKFILGFISRRSVTTVNVAEALNISENSADKILSLLNQKGWIKRNNNQWSYLSK